MEADLRRGRAPPAPLAPHGSCGLLLATPDYAARARGRGRGARARGRAAALAHQQAHLAAHQQALRRRSAAWRLVRMIKRAPRRARSLAHAATRRERQAGLAALGAELESAHALAQHAEEARAEHAPHLRGLLHHACVPASVWATAGLARAARSRAQLAGALAFGGGTCMMFAASAALHRGPALWGGTPWSRRRPWTCPAKAHFFSRLDRVGIFTAIAGGYYGLVGLALRGGKRVAVLSAVAVTSGIGALSHLTLALRGHNKDGTTPTFLPRWAEAAACTALSFAFLLAGPGALANGMGTEVYRRVRAGGVAYIAGAACYALKWPDCWLDKAPRWWGSHEMFHAGTVAGAAMHFRAMFDLVSRAHIMPA